MEDGTVGRGEVASIKVLEAFLEFPGADLDGAEDRAADLLTDCNRDLLCSGGAHQVLSSKHSRLNDVLLCGGPKAVGPGLVEHPAVASGWVLG